MLIPALSSRCNLKCRGLQSYDDEALHLGGGGGAGVVRVSY